VANYNILTTKIFRHFGLALLYAVLAVSAVFRRRFFGTGRAF
jgi:hypothetical protein